MYLLPAVLARGLFLFASCLAGEGGDDAAVQALPPFVAPNYEVSSDEPAVRSGLPSLPEPGDELFVEEFTTLDRARWSEAGGEGGPATGPPGGAAAGSSSGAVIKHLPSAPGAQGVVVLAAKRGAMKRTIDIVRADALVVTVRARSFAPTRPATVRVVQRIAGRTEPVVTEVALPAAPSFVDTRVVIDRIRGREHGVEVQLIAGDGALIVDRIEAQCLRPVEREWLVPRAVAGSPDDALPAARIRVGLVSMDTETEGCFVPIGGAVRWKAFIPKEAPRLDLSTSLIGGDFGGAAEWVVEVDSARVATRTEKIVAGEWWTCLTPWVVPLEAFAGREVAVGLRCAGDRNVVGFAGTPNVLSAAPAGAPPNVVLISLDTLRADRVGAHAGRPSLTPHLDELARRGALFTDASSTSGWTLPAHVSLLSGLHPLTHGVHSLDDRIDPARARLLSERFRAAGYSTAAFTSGGLVDPHFGFSRGFETYSVRDPCGMSRESVGFNFSGRERPPTDDEIDATPRRAFDWIRRHADGRFFLFLHTYCVHEYDDDCATKPELQRTEMMKKADAGDRATTTELVRRYDAAVGEVDRTLVGGVLALLDELALRERTLVVVVSDHGEEFGEHGHFGHAMALGHEVGAVAMVLAGPGVPAGARIDKPVSLTDVAVTLARLSGLPRDPEWRGVDLFDPPPEEPRCRVLFLDTGHFRSEAMWFDGWLVQRRWDPETKAATLTLEKRNPETGAIVAVEPTEAQLTMLVRRLDYELAQRLVKTSGGERDGHDLSPELRARLRALGYIDH